jgi:hypothetical protein
MPSCSNLGVSVTAGNQIVTAEGLQRDMDGYQFIVS